MPRVPFVDLKIQYESIRGEMEEAIHHVIDQTAFSGGLFVSQFEKEFASFCDSPYAMGVGSGTEALWLALRGLGVTQGDEVITVPNTFTATAAAISFCGAQPVFVDIEEPSYNMNPTLIEASITPRTKAIIPVHLFGQIADMDPIIEIAQRYGLRIIEDACQAHGAEYKGRKAGSMGDAGCFSFYPSKNLGAYGEAGAVVTHDGDLAEKVRMLRDHGQSKKYYHDLIGWNARMDGLQAAILSVKLRHLPQWNAERQRHAQRYNALFRGTEGVMTPSQAEYAKHVYHLYVLRVKNRDHLIASLLEEGIQCGIHYPLPIHLQEAYRFLNLHEGSYPVAEKCSKEFISLPMFPELTDGQINCVVDGVKRYIR